MADQKLEDLAIKKEQSEKPKPVEVKIPDDILKVINDLKAEKGQLINQFLNLSFQVGELKDRQDETRKKVKDNNEQTSQKIKYAFDKLKLKKRKNYRWGFDGKRDIFIGTLIPEKPKKEEKK